LYNNLLDIFAKRAGLFDLVGYVVSARLILALRPSRIRSALFAAASLGLVLYWLWDGPWKLVLAVYLGFVSAQAMLFAWQSSSRWAPLLPIFFPVVALVAMESVGGAGAVLGFSYLAFRMAHNGYEIVSGRAERAGFFDYLAYCLFLPTLIVGPISPLSQFQSSFAERKSQTTLWHGMLRIIIGLVKVRFIATICKQLTFSVLWGDGFLHGPEDFVVSCAADLLYLYFNFSGFCDIVIAIAALIGIDVRENFQSPFSARNLREYWTRWHITLGDVANALVFTPLSQSLGRAWGRRFSDAAICVAIFATFCVIGLWHGFTLNFLFYGIAHGIGVSAVYVFDLWVKRRFGAKRRKAYLANRWARAAAVTLTLSYAAGTMFLFDNDTRGMQNIVEHLRWSTSTTESVMHAAQAAR